MQPTSFFTKIKNFVAGHIKTTLFVVIVIVVAIILVVRSTRTTTATTSYVLGTVQPGTVVSTVSGTGQVSTSDTLAITPQVSGTLESISVQPGASVAKGQTLFVVDPTDAEKTLRDAKLNLASAQLDLESFQAQTASSATDQGTAVSDAYNNLLNSNPEAVPTDNITATYTAPTISGNYTLGKEGAITISTYSSSAGISFNASGLATGSGIANNITPEPIGNSGLYVSFPAKTTYGLTWTINLPNTAANNYLSNYNAYQSALETQTENNAANGVTNISLQTKELAVTQAQNAVTDAEDTLAEYYVTAPFTGTLASIPVVVGQQVSSGTTLGTVITNQEEAVIPLNEVDAANVTLGQKATMTFDAISNLTMTGKVVEVDTIGTVSQGVVNYNVKIAFDTEDPRIKSGMSVSATIATQVAQDVLIVPSTAIKGSGDSEYVLTATSATDPAPVQVPVTTGISDDANTQVLSGLTAGQQVVTRTVTSTSAKPAATATPSILSSLGGGSTRGLGGGGYSGGGGARTTTAGK